MAIDKLISEKREEIVQIAKKHGVKSISLFGSYARGEATKQSDVDFLITTGKKTSSWFPAGLVLDLESILNCKVEVVSKKYLHSYIKESVLAEAVRL